MTCITKMLICDYPDWNLLDYSAEICGICEKTGNPPYTYWSSPNSERAHKKCVEQIHPIESKLIERINSLFESDRAFRNRVKVHIFAIRDIKKYFGDMTIQECIEKKGVQEVTFIFNTIGRMTVERYARDKGIKVDIDLKKICAEAKQPQQSKL